MTDTALWFRRQLSRELDRLRDGGIPDEVIAAPVPLTRAQKGRVLHQNPRCSRLTRTTAAVTVPVDLPDLITEPSLCPSCLTVWGPPVSEALNAARSLVGFRERFAARPARLPFGDVLSFTSDSWRAKDLAKTAHPALGPILTEHANLLDEVVAEYSSADITFGRRIALHHRCVRERLAPRGSRPPHRSEDLAIFGGLRRRLARVVLDAAWQAWGQALDRGVDPETSAAEAVAAGGAQAGNRPPDGSQTLPGARIDPAWVAARDVALTTIVAGWTRELAQAAAVSEASPQSLHIRKWGSFSSTGWDASPLVKSVLDLYEPFRHRDEYLVRVPAAIADRAAEVALSRSRYDEVQNLGPALNDDWAVYETAFTLRDREPAQDLAYHLNTARLVLR